VTHPVHRPGHVGARFPKVDGAVKADGSGIYADDIHLPRMLHAKILRSPHANARIRGIDVRAAEKYPGVVATLVGAEMPAKYGVIPWTHDEQALAVDHARFVGDEVACVAAVDERTAEEALQLVRVDYRGGTSTLWKREVVTFPRSTLSTPIEKRRDKGKSWLAAGLITASALLAARVFAGAIGGGGGPDTPPTPAN